MVDCGFVPRRIARRAADARLLFARAEIPVGTMLPAGEALESGLPLTPAEQRAERLAFFWMMAAVAAKYTARARLAEANDAPDSRAQQNAEWVLPFMAREIAGVLGGPPEFPETSTPVERLRLLCDQVELSQGERSPARAAVEAILGLVD